MIIKKNRISTYDSLDFFGFIEGCVVGTKGLLLLEPGILKVGTKALIRLFEPGILNVSDNSGLG